MKHISRYIAAATVIAALVLPAIVRAGDGDLKTVLAGMQKRYEATKTYRTAFEQTLTSEAFKKVIRTASGTIYFERPGKIRWEYAKPDKHMFLIDGETFWDYDEAMKQVIKIPVKDALAGATPQGFLFGAGDFSKDFDVKLIGHQKTPPHQGYALSLTPKDKDLKGAMSNFELLVADDDFRVLEAKFKDAQGNTNHYTFTDPVLNPTLDPNLFVFTVPDGVKVILPAIKNR